MTCCCQFCTVNAKLDRLTQMVTDLAANFEDWSSDQKAIAKLTAELKAANDALAASEATQPKVK